jgi:type III secretion protein L
MSKIVPMFPADSHLPRGAAGSVLHADEVQAWQDGHQFLAAAQARANLAEEAARRHHADESARGYQEGKAAGVVEATRLVTETMVKVDRYLESIEPQVADLAVRMVRRMLGNFDVTDLVAAAAAHAVAELRSENILKVMVHPEAVERVRAALADVDLGRIDVMIDADPKLDKAACTVASRIAVIDAGIETQLTAMAAAIGATRQCDVTS